MRGAFLRASLRAKQKTRNFVAKSHNATIMDIETLREYCLSLPLATEDMPFDETTLVFRVLGKIFAMIDLDRPQWVSLKCNPDYALVLRDEHDEITGAWHMNKKYWNYVNLEGRLENGFIPGLVRHSYSEVVKKLTLKERAVHEIINSVHE